MRYYILHVAKSVITKSWCFLRASGGVSIIDLSQKPRGEFSPRKRRCFHASAFRAFERAGFLRASGGVSRRAHLQHRQGRFSPRKRRCFRLRKARRSQSPVFSAQAEVFLLKELHMYINDGFLRASGGVS